MRLFFYSNNFKLFITTPEKYYVGIAPTQKLTQISNYYGNPINKKAPVIFWTEALI